MFLLCSIGLQIHFKKKILATILSIYEKMVRIYFIIEHRKENRILGGRYEET